MPPDPMMEDAGLGLSGWLAVLAYGLAAWLCLRSFMVEKSGPPRPYAKAIAALWRVVKKHWPAVPGPARRAGLWVAVAVVMAGLGINRLFDIETLLLDWWREDAMQQGSYGGRRANQGGFIGAVAIVGLCSAVALLRIARGQLRDFRLVLTGAVFVVAFVVIRAASLHAVDAIMRHRIAGISVSVGVELLGLSVVMVAAVRRLRRAQAPILWGWTKRSKTRGAPPPDPPDEPPATITQLG